MRPLRRLLPDRADLLVLAGLASAGAGLWILHPSAALVVLGAFAVAMGLRSS